MNERRAGDRREIGERALVVRVGGDEERLLVRNLSISGLFLERAFPHYPLGERVQLAPESWPSALGPLVGEVVFTTRAEQHQQGMGVRFTALTDAQRELLVEQYLRSPRHTRGRAIGLSSLFGDRRHTVDSFCTRFTGTFLLPSATATGPISRDARVYFLRDHGDGAFGWSIGRDLVCDVRVKDARVSRLHATIEPQPVRGMHAIIDQGSHNGTRVDGRRLRAGDVAALSSGSVLEFGGVPMTFLSCRDLFAAVAPGTTKEEELIWKSSS
jgi:hypothetical protein